MENKPSSDFVLETVTDILGNSGFEIHPFLIGWYNKHVDKPFALPYDDDTLTLLVISTPNMYEKAFREFITREECIGAQDPIDQCISHYFSEVKKRFKDIQVDAIHDFELHHSRRPKVLVQTAGHISGACYYYRRTDVDPDPWGESKKIFGVCVHPKYGGWFALRGVLVFNGILCPDLVKKDAVDIVPSHESRVELLELFNFHWQDWRFRDVVPVLDKYSEDQKEYFSTPPKQRKAVIESQKSKWNA